MPSIPPPLPRSPACPTPWSIAPQGKQDSHQGRINWSVIFASTSLAFALVVSIVAWIATHPRPTALPLPSISESTIEPPALPHTSVISVTEAFHRSPPRDRIAKNIPLMEEEAPLLPPPSSSPPLRWNSPEGPPRQTPPSAGETYGTQVLFHNNQAAAADLARREHKLLFVMHISGNFEDSCFT